jgi:hypothetical protein
MPPSKSQPTSCDTPSLSRAALLTRQQSHASRCDTAPAHTHTDGALQLLAVTPPPPSQIQSTAYIGYECNRTASRLSQQNKQSRSQCVQLHQVIKIFNTRISSKPLRVCDGLPMRSKNTFVLVCWSQTSLSSRLIMPSTSCIQFKAPLTPPANTHAYTRPFQHNAETCRAGLCCHQALSPVRVVAGQKTKTQPQPGPQRVTTHSVGSVCVTMTTM